MVQEHLNYFMVLILLKIKLRERLILLRLKHPKYLNITITEFLERLQLIIR